jgi:hypothetical protein
MMSETKSGLEGLQDWYRSQCNGQWEHTYGISVGTLDNPGWSIEIDLKDTVLESKGFADHETNGGDDWCHCRVRDGQFQGFCSPQRLTDLIEIFLNWARNAQ